MPAIELLDPIGYPTQEDADPVPGLPSLRGKVVTLMENRHKGSGPFMQRLKELFEAQGQVQRAIFCAKPSLSRPAPDDLRTEIIERSHAVITGVGT